MRSSRLIIKINVHKQLTRSRFGRKFHDLLTIFLTFFFIFFEFIIHLRSSSNNFVGNRQSNVIYENLNIFVTIICSISPLAHHLHCLPKHVDLLQNLGNLCYMFSSTFESHSKDQLQKVGEPPETLWYGCHLKKSVGNDFL